MGAVERAVPNIAELDAVFIRALPAILASAGLHIIRAPAEPVPPS
jgi:hypothetical protein